MRRFCYLAVLMASLVVAPSAAARSITTALTPQPEGEPPLGAVDIRTVSNGCGGGLGVTIQNKIGNSSVYRNDNNPFGPRYPVEFKAACDLHDAGYTGAKVWDAVNGQWIDFFGWTKEQVDQKFFDDMRKLCEAQIPDNARTALADCKGTGGTTSFGAETRYNLVKNHGAGYLKRPNLSGDWHEGSAECGGYNREGFLRAGNKRVTVTQHGRLVTAKWEDVAQSPSGNLVTTHEFSGTLVTHDAPRNDEVVGTETVRPSSATPKSWPVTINLTRQPVYERQGMRMAEPNGPDLSWWRPGRAELSAGDSNASCRKQGPPPTTSTQASTPAPAAGSFVLDTALTEIKNPNAPELTITATAGTAVWDHTGQYGGAGNAGDWKVTYSYKVPGTLVAGKDASITLGLAVSNVNPVQPNGYQMSALAPDFAKALSINYPNQTQATQQYNVPISAGYKDAKELVITIGVVSAQVVFHYKRTGA